MYSWDNPDDRLFYRPDEFRAPARPAGAPKRPLCHTSVAVAVFCGGFGAVRAARYFCASRCSRRRRSANFIRPLKRKFRRSRPALRLRPRSPKGRTAEAIKRVVRVFQGAARALCHIRRAAQQSRESADVAVFFCRSARPREDCRTSRSAHSESFFL